MAYLLKSDGTRVENVGTSLSVLQGLVGGYIEIVKTKDGKDMVVNEDGKSQGLPLNEEATAMYVYGDSDVILGDVVICEKRELK